MTDDIRLQRDYWITQAQEAWQKCAELEERLRKLDCTVMVRGEPRDLGEFTGVEPLENAAGTGAP